MKKFLIKTLCVLMLVTVAFSTFACKKDPNKNKATLYVYSFTSGFGSEWLTELIKDYEALHVNDKVGGKTGIHVQPTTLNSNVAGGEMAGRDEVVYFLEQQDYSSLIAGNYIADITDAITGDNPYDEGDGTLEDKMYDDQKDYLGRKDSNGKVHYYAYPHYLTNFGIVYDVDRFNEKGYYLMKGYNVANGVKNCFLGVDGMKNNWTKTDGPDQTPNTSDDGLPTTYEEFFMLCDYIANTGNDNPLIWSGQHRYSYLTHFINALATDYEGYEQMRLNFTFDGTAENLGTVKNGQFTFDATDTEIDQTNGNELARQAGKYYAIKFYDDLYDQTYIKNDANDLTLFNSGYDHLTAQEDFLKRGTKRNVMLLDGSWWEMEATGAFEDLAGTNDAYSKENKKLGWMPLPKQSAEKITQSGKKQTVYDIYYPLCMVKNGLDVNSWQYKYAIDFIQFANSQEQLAQFTQITSAVKSLKYDLTSDQKSSLTPYGKSYYEYIKNADIVFPYDNNVVFNNNQLKLQSLSTDGKVSPLYHSGDKRGLIEVIEKGVSAETHFNGMYTYFSSSDIW
ncbi:MAG: hypothetical protein IJW64_04160 [Clostridia bacterium]|nr:hypothetical protein [Clostridia bacterium]